MEPLGRNLGPFGPEKPTLALFMFLPREPNTPYIIMEYGLNYIGLHIMIIGNYQYSCHLLLEL